MALVIPGHTCLHCCNCSEIQTLNRDYMVQEVWSLVEEWFKCTITYIIKVKQCFSCDIYYDLYINLKINYKVVIAVPSAHHTYKKPFLCRIMRVGLLAPQQPLVGFDSKYNLNVDFYLFIFFKKKLYVIFKYFKQKCEELTPKPSAALSNTDPQLRTQKILHLMNWKHFFFSSDPVLPW